MIIMFIKMVLRCHQLIQKSYSVQINCNDYLIASHAVIKKMDLNQLVEESQAVCVTKDNGTIIVETKKKYIKVTVVKPNLLSCVKEIFHYMVINGKTVMRFELEI